MTAALDLAKAALASASVAASAEKAAGTSFWKKLMWSSICSRAISV